MGPDIAINVGRWYLRWDKNEIFQVIGQDPDSGRISIRNYEGDIDHLSMDQWRALRPGLADAPSDWTGPVDLVDELAPDASLPPGFIDTPLVSTTRIRRILVAVREAGNYWTPAVAKATQIARAIGAQIELFHCVDAAVTLEQLATYRHGVDEFESVQRRSWEEGLERLATQVRRHGVHVSFAAPVDHPAHEGIMRHARRFHADLIVTDAHRGTHFAPSVMQEVDWELVRRSAAPLLIVRQPRPYVHPRVLAALDPGQHHSTPEGLDRKILEFAESFSQALKGHLHAMHAFPVPGAYLEASAGVSTSVAAELQAMDAGRAQAALDALLLETHIPSENRHTLPGPPADAIVLQAAELNVSIVVMGSIARSGMSGLFIGNTAEKILARLPCDLLLLKPDGFRDSVFDQRRGARVISTGMVL